MQHDALRQLLQRRIRDGVVLRLIGKWLNAWVWEDGTLTHPEKTRLVRFVRPHGVSSQEESSQKASGTFELLGFTHYWGRSRNGYWVVKRKTARSRLRRAIRAVATWCREHLHRPVAEPHRTLCQKLRGHDAYYGITGNSWSLSTFREQAERAWRTWLSRRNRDHPMTWELFGRLLERYPLPTPRIMHSV